MFKLANKEDIDEILIILNNAKSRMKEDGLEQWNDESGYPNKNTLLNDIETKTLYKFVKDETIAGICVINNDFYDQYPVEFDKVNSRVIHRVAVNERFLGQGIGYQLYQNAITTSKENGFKTLVVDTYSKNIKMVNLIKKCGFETICEFELKPNLPNWVLFQIKL